MWTFQQIFDWVNEMQSCILRTKRKKLIEFRMKCLYEFYIIKRNRKRRKLKRKEHK